MYKLLLASFLLFSGYAIAQSDSSRTPVKGAGHYTLVIHGGAGNISKATLPEAAQKEYTAALNQALETGQRILASGGTALNAVEAVVNFMEDNPLFNAGKGAVFTNEGRNELDAAIMDGRTLKAGAVAGVTTIKNPVTAARAVMERSPHVMMTGAGADQFAKEQGLAIVPPLYFYTEKSWRNLQQTKAADSIQKLKKDSAALKQSKATKYDYAQTGLMGKYGTVGAVALDQYGNMAAATSTGGMSNKKFGRIGDAPIIGAGTYADNHTAAISCTGHGEFFIRLVMAKSICDMMEFGKLPLQQSADNMVMRRLPALGGDGGLIAVDKDGNIAMPFCTAGMFRGYVKSSGEKMVKLFRE